jgi:mRNA interferase RelE/StbE
MLRRVVFSDEARSDVRTIDRATALRLLKALTRFLETDSGDVRQLEGFNPPMYRLRIGDWRILFRRRGDAVEVVRVLNRSEAYR